MILSKEFYDHCCPTYQKLIDEFEKELIVLNDPIKIRAAVMKFSRSYLTPKKYWDRCFAFTCDVNTYHDRYFWPEWITLCRKTAERAYCHLHFDKNWGRFRLTNGSYASIDVYNGKYLKLIDNTNSFYVNTKQNIRYPHSDLERFFGGYQEYYLRSKQLIDRYEAMKKLYSKIKAVEEDVHEWFKLLLEVDDIKFVKDNVEFRLGKNYFDVELWKLYFGFLKERGEYKLLLLTYSKYCRFFLDDREVLEEYKNAMIQYGPVYLPWDNLFEFEVKMEEAQEEEVLEFEEALPLDRSLCSTFYDTYQVQNFAFLGPLIHYVLEHANHLVLRKLFSSCKYFFAKKSTPICYRLEDTETETMFNGETLSLHGSANLDLFVENVYVTGAICFDKDDNLDISIIISRIYRCEAKFIHLCVEKISFNELKFLIQHGGVLDLDILKCDIFDDNDEYIDLEEIMKYLPNIEVLCLPSVKFNANTGHALSQLTFNAKFNTFTIDLICGEPFDAHEFLKYALANRDDKCHMSLEFDDDEFDADFIEDFSKIMDEFNHCEVRN